MICLLHKQFKHSFINYRNSIPKLHKTPPNIAICEEKNSSKNDNILGHFKMHVELLLKT